MNRVKNDNSGFTLLETVVAVALTSLLLTFLLTAFLTLSRTYNAVVDSNLIQEKSLYAMDFLKYSVQNASDLRVVSSSPEQQDGYSAIWCEGDKLYYQNHGEQVSIYMQDTSFTVTFIGDGQKLGILLGAFTEGESYLIESAVALQNVQEISGGSGIGIQFKRIPNTN